MKKQDFYYELPEELIAQDPLADRSSSRLLVLDRQSGAVSHHVFREILDYLQEGDCLVINDTKVIPARLIGSKVGTEAKVEVLLLKRKENNIWETLVKPGKKARPGAKISFGDGLLVGEVLEVVEEGNRLVQFSYEGIFEEILDRLGQMPLPPYITHQLQERERYNTVYAVHEGSAAAPTAGLHFTPELLQEIEKKGVDCKGHTSRWAWNLPAGEGGGDHGSSYALRILSDPGGSSGEDQPCKVRNRAGHLRWDDELPDGGIRCG